MSKLTRRTGVAVAAATMSLLAIPAAYAHDSGGDGDRGDGLRARSYINSDMGANRSVDPNSSCRNRDQADRQRLSSRASGDPGDRNVHNDACFLDKNGVKSDGPASFQSFGVGYISACPDPDGAGPKYAVLRDTNRDGRNDLCFQSGYQETGLSGDMEFHARVNNTTELGDQRVTWCSDADADGCRDEDVKDSISVRWVR